MSSAPVHHPTSEDSNVIYGLNYPPDFLSSLPILLPRPTPHTPIRALSASQFATLHHLAITSHAPDHVLFPFLHGLEGDNEQQNAFFTSPTTPIIRPRFRGLIWVACEDDDTPSSDDDGDSDVVASDDSDDDEHGSDGGDLGHSFELDMDVDIDTDLDLDRNHHKPEAPGSSSPSTSTSEPTDPSCDTSDPDNNALHMHPVKSRAPRIYTNTTIARDRSVSSSSTSSTSSRSRGMPSPSTPATSLDSPSPSCMPLGPPSPEPRPRIAPLIVSGFKARDLLKLNADGNAEFVPLRVPEGISLRNFDIQVVRILSCLFFSNFSPSLSNDTCIICSSPWFFFSRAGSSIHYMGAFAIP
ncbi:hypothetical protein B0F90DRAFT_971012 [Multifurca ochricompacta]|uniref:Uncharacterized protein n=1 Tax=Multifurca ochricompacta TaxID=376703 RepID=A0AAD4MBM0_9AGAM|nr:hypothetical protein B0F90DRAFT_971012 [Multifurca ochricompacta]